MKYRNIIIGFVSNFFEWYDFSIFAFLAPILAVVFFNSHNSKIGLIQTFIVFSVSYLMRPLGSIVFGVMGDKIGREFILKLSMTLMAFPTVLIGLLPSFQTGGFYSITALVVLRLIQGFAAGGEFPSCACYIYENSNHNKRIMCSLVAASPILGVLFGSLCVMLLFFFFSKNELIHGAWRLPFLFSFIIIIFLYWIRKIIIDQQKSFTKESRPLYFLIKKKTPALIQVMLLHLFISVFFYLLFVWMPSYLNIYLDFSRKNSVIISSTGLFILIVSTVILGYFFRHVSEKKMILFGIISVIIFTYPAFFILHQKSLLGAYFVITIYALCLGCVDSVIMSLMGYLFPQSLRCSGMSIGFTLPTAIFGGLLPTICSYFIYKTGWTLLPSLFLILAGFIGLCAAYSLKDKYIEAI